MKRTKMTKAIAEAIAADLLIQTIPEQMKAAVNERRALAAKLLDHFFKPEDIAAMNALPKHYHPSLSERLYVQYNNNSSIYIRIDGSVKSTSSWDATGSSILATAKSISEELHARIEPILTEKKPHRSDFTHVPDCGSSGNSKYRVRDELAEEIEAHLARAAILESGQWLLNKEGQLVSILRKFGTVDELENGWPEVWSVAKNHLVKDDAKAPKPKSLLPSISIARLNAELGLPV